MTLSWPELAVCLLSLLLVANAARRGFMREGSLLLGLGLALWLAGQLYRPLQAGLPPEVTTSPWHLVTYAALALVLLLGAVALSALVAPVVRRGPLSALDRMIGCLVGLAEATFVVGLLAMLGQRLGALHPAAGGPTAFAINLASLTIGWLSASLPPELIALTRLQ